MTRQNRPTTALTPDLVKQWADWEVSRRSLFKGAGLIASAFSVGQAAPAIAQGKQIKLAYCSQLLCGVPCEVARSAGIFKAHGLDVQFVYTRGVSTCRRSRPGCWAT